jgi:hypothetical protein
LCAPLSAAFAQEDGLLKTPRPCFQYAEFRQEKVLQGLPRPLVSSGRILLDCNRGTLWNTRTPIEETLIYTFDGKHWLVKADGEVLSIKNAAQKRIGDILARIVRGDREFIEKYFHRETAGRTTRLLPAQKRLKKYIESIDLQELSEGLRVTVTRTDGQNMLLVISALRDLPSLNAKSCSALLQTDAGCAQLFPAAEG